MENIAIPPELSSNVNSETKDFTIKARRAQPFKESSVFIMFGTFWVAITGIFPLVFFSPILFGKEVQFELNGVPTVASIDNLDPLILPAIITGIFVTIGLGVLAFGLYSTFKKGGYFIGTPSRLVHFLNGNIRSLDWEQFTGNIEVSGNDKNGNISLHLRDDSAPVYISGIPNVYEIEQICRIRIKENDPTPANKFSDHNNYI